MQFSFLPTEPHHCRWTPGVLSPCLTSLVSSRIPTECGPEWSSRTIPWRSSRNRSWSQWCWLRNSCKVLGGTPALMAIGSTLFSGMSESWPEM